VEAVTDDRLRAEMLPDAPRVDVPADGRLKGRQMLMWPGYPFAIAADAMDHQLPCEWPALRCCCPPPEVLP
jgi:hypothetical protein